MLVIVYMMSLDALRLRYRVEYTSAVTPFCVLMVPEPEIADRV